MKIQDAAPKESALSTRFMEPITAVSVPRPFRLASRVIAAAAVAALVLTGLSLLAEHHWLLELLTHLRMQAAVGCGVLALAALVARQRWSALVLAVLAVVNVGFMTAYLWPDGAGAGAGTVASSFRILSVNVGLRNTRYHAMRELIGDTNPDLIGLLEVDAGWAGSLEPLAAEYPFRISRPREDAFGLMLLSKYPLREVDGSPYVHDGVQTAILAELQLEDGRATVVLAHPHSPMTPSKAEARNAQLAKLADIFRNGRERPGILFGDLNVTPWSPFFASLEQDSGLTSAARGHGYLPTWPTALSFLGIPIDHCLLSGIFRAERVRTGPDVGSDHWPLLVDVSLLATPANDSRESAETAGFDRE